MTLMTQKLGVCLVGGVFTYRRIDVKYWSRKSLACSSTTSGLRASVVINGKFAPCTMLPMQTAREHANALLGVCCSRMKREREKKTLRWKTRKLMIKTMNNCCSEMYPVCFCGLSLSPSLVCFISWKKITDSGKITKTQLWNLHSSIRDSIFHHTTKTSLNYSYLINFFQKVFQRGMLKDVQSRASLYIIRETKSFS